jgi:RimJ/RimL family protein N-acetyltransferase
MIRPFAPGDLTGLTAAIDAVCGEGRWMSTRRFEPTPAWEHALGWPRCSRHLLLVAEIERTIVGWCRLFPTGPCNGFQPEVSLGIGVLQSYRDQGIGTSLVHQALRWASSSGMWSVTLSTRTNNARAIHVFEKCEFRVTDCLVDECLR